jgi:hypothetical protein
MKNVGYEAERQYIALVSERISAALPPGPSRGPRINLFIIVNTKFWSFQRWRVSPDIHRLGPDQRL